MAHSQLAQGIIGFERPLELCSRFRLDHPTYFTLFFFFMPFLFFFFLLYSFSTFSFFFYILFQLFLLLKIFLRLGHISNPLFEGVLSLKELLTLKVNSILARGLEPMYTNEIHCECVQVPQKNRLIERYRGGQTKSSTANHVHNPNLENVQIFHMKTH